jgi:hypothetical protein
LILLRRTCTQSLSFCFYFILADNACFSYAFDSHLCPVLVFLSIVHKILFSSSAISCYFLLFFLLPARPSPTYYLVLLIRQHVSTSPPLFPAPQFLSPFFPTPLYTFSHPPFRPSPSAFHPEPILVTPTPPVLFLSLPLLRCASSYSTSRQLLKPR